MHIKNYCKNKKRCLCKDFGWWWASHRPYIWNIHQCIGEKLLSPPLGLVYYSTGHRDSHLKQTIRERKCKKKKHFFSDTHSKRTLFPTPAFMSVRHCFHTSQIGILQLVWYLRRACRRGHSDSRLLCSALLYNSSAIATLNFCRDGIIRPRSDTHIICSYNMIWYEMYVVVCLSVCGLLTATIPFESTTDFERDGVFEGP